MLNSLIRFAGWSGGVAEAESRKTEPSIYSYILLMINNSSLQKWDRLMQKQLYTQFVNSLIQGMNCSQFEAKAILKAVYETYQPFFDNSGAMKPGQIVFEVVSIENGAQKNLSECKMVSVVLTLDAGEEDLQIKEYQGVQGL